ncbi:MAG: phenylacetate-CoA oxygenase subunit PaaI [Cryomorphaceae bacterium]|nr:MAG: phenylacetate-CoA oxygenase subunit PaaI [Cryomorphaceae bacterium]
MTSKEALFNYVLKLGDSSLIMGHRLSEWTAHGPVLEHDIALTNIALDHIGQARMLLTYAGELEDKGRTEDDLAYWRDASQYRNSLLCELPNGDFGQTIVKMFLFDAFQVELHEALSQSPDEQLKAIAVKSLKESKYHLRYSRDWVFRLGDGTEESKIRIANGLETVWMYFGDLFEPAQGEDVLEAEKVIPDTSALRLRVEQTIRDTFTQATLALPDFDAVMQEGSQRGIHTEDLSYILSEMQSVTRMHPGATW